MTKTIVETRRFITKEAIGPSNLPALVNQRATTNSYIRLIFDPVDQPGVSCEGRTRSEIDRLATERMRCFAGERLRRIVENPVERQILDGIMSESSLHFGHHIGVGRKTLELPSEDFFHVFAVEQDCEAV